MNYRMKIQYDGSRYKGWQRQTGSDADTIQGRLEQVLSKHFGQMIEIQGAGRTDAGVHAQGQVANFRVDAEVDAEVLRLELNEYLPEDIRILELTKASERFHSRLNAIGKIYEYRILKKDRQDVFGRKYAWHCETTLDVDKMREAAGFLIGKYDFAGFCTKASKKKSTVRTIYNIDIEEDENYIVLRYEGNGFLYNMVRILTGTLVEIGCEKMPVDQVGVILDSKNRKLAGETAPAKGLMLVEVKYD